MSGRLARDAPSEVLGHDAFAEHLPVAVEAAERLRHPLALLLIGSDARQGRGRARVERALAGVEGSVYALQPGVDAIIATDVDGRGAVATAIWLQWRLAGGILRPGTTISAGIAEQAPGLDAGELFARAAEALKAADRDGGVQLYGQAASGPKPAALDAPTSSSKKPDVP